MRPWRWQVPRIHQTYIESQPHAILLQLIALLDQVEQTIDGVPQTGSVIEIDDDIFEWIVAGNRILYERLQEQQYLNMVDIHAI